MKNKLDKIFQEIYEKHWGMKKSELKKSRPRISFPKFKRVNTRPDQEVQILETPRQARMFGHRVANDSIPKGIRYPARVGRRIVRTPEEAYEGQAKAVAGDFSRTVLGVNYGQGKDQVQSAAIAGKLRTKFEPPDESRKQDLSDYANKVQAAKDKYHEDYAQWKTGQDKLPYGSTEWYNNIANKPKFKKPRRPSLKGRATTDLSPEEITSRGRSTSSTIEHEGLHNVMDHLEKFYGPRTAALAMDGMKSQFKKESWDSVGKFIQHSLGYKPNSKHFEEEILAHSRDILVDPVKRGRFKRFLEGHLYGGKHTPEQVDEHIKNLKIGHQNAYKYAQNLDPKDFE